MYKVADYYIIYPSFKVDKGRDKETGDSLPPMKTINLLRVMN